MTKETKSLSQQICELCGIEYEKSIMDETYRRMCDHGDPRCTQISSTRKAKLDFENPENFVKLLELNVSESSLTIGKIIVNNLLLCANFIRRECLETLLKILTLPENQGSHLLNDIKQAIRDYNGWVWG